jgi:hypothetical protein
MTGRCAPWGRSSIARVMYITHVPWCRAHGIATPHKELGAAVMQLKARDRIGE